ncbi:MAG: PQQ-binding-like beta-propeller repeat protein [Verrucomicrobiales bacterium]|nr:PQQ-binding-like beta-propeller repeat protein [Verrucomicrobiales bacterium]
MEKNLPVAISKTDHLAWQTELSGPGSSTPAVWDKSVFITASGKDLKGVIASRLDLYTGKVIWSREICNDKRHDRRSDLAGPSPTTDGDTVVFLSGAGDLKAFDFDGKLKWEKNLQAEYGQFSLKWTYSSSPVLFEGTLYLQILQRNESVDGVVPGRSSFLIALDPGTGAEKWQHTRRSQAVGESLEAYSTPIPISHKGRPEILVSGADCLTGHDPADGREMWRWETWNRDRVRDWRVIPSPVYGDDMIVACAPKGQPAYTFFAGSSGTVNHGDLKWRSKIDAISCDVTTPLFYNGFFYFLNGRKKMLSCVEPYSGKIEWSQPIPARAKLEASPSAADGKIYTISHTGEIFIYKAGADFELLHSTVLGQDSDANNRSTIVPAQGRLLIRVGSDLWCMD